MSIDPREVGVALRLADVRRIVAVTGGKGGIGKSVVASTLALGLAAKGGRTGLLDLDFTSPSSHVLLGYPTGFPAEEHGVDPCVHHGIACMSIAHFSGSRPVPLRGGDLTNALLEILAITRWGALDTLVVDMPPGLGDTALDTIRMLGRAEHLLVATASRVVLESVGRTLDLLTGLSVPILGVLENMRRGESDAVARLAAQHGVPFLGALPWDAQLEEAVGDAHRFAHTQVAVAMREQTTVLTR